MPIGIKKKGSHVLWWEPEMTVLTRYSSGR